MTVRLLRGDNRELMAGLPEQSVHAIVTSPPYWGLRDYGTPPLDWPAIEYSPMPGLPPCVSVPAMSCQMGLEPTLEAFIGHMVQTFRMARRVLRDDGTCWVNMGDAYAGSGRGGEWPGSTLNGTQTNHSRDAKTHQAFTADQKNASSAAGRSKSGSLKPKDLMGQPWRVAFALQADGWRLRQDVIWSKPNPMPESTRDRCTKAHEYVFLLAKSARYAWDFEAMQEPVNGGAHARRAGNVSHKGADAYAGGDEHHRTKGGLLGYDARQAAKRANNGVGFGHGTDREERGRTRQTYKTPDGWDTRTGQGGHGSFHAEGREKGRVLPEGVGRRAGPPGNPSERKLAPAGSGTKLNESYDAAIGSGDLTATRNRRSVWTVPSEPFKEAHFATFPPALVEPCIKASVPLGGWVLDPFGGSGTTAMVADRLQRNAIVMEINPAYADIAERRVTGDAPLFADVQT